jgi:hypothetical protein
MAKDRRESLVHVLELLGILRAIHAREVEHELAARQRGREIGFGGRAGDRSDVGVSGFPEREPKILSDESIAAGDDDPHRGQDSTVAGSPFRVAWMYGSFSSMALVSARFSCVVFCEV